MPKPKILFLSGQEIFNELDKKRYFEAISSSVHAQYAFILKVNEQYTDCLLYTSDAADEL